LKISHALLAKLLQLKKTLLLVLLLLRSLKQTLSMLPKSTPGALCKGSRNKRLRQVVYTVAHV
jgi:hypothetical protein